MVILLAQAVVGVAAYAAAPLIWPVLVGTIGRVIYKNWKEQTNASDEADKRKAEILNS
jgi:hypothetical protein